MRRRIQILILIVLFFASLLPAAIGGSRYFRDERYYTDAAIRMVQSGDYFTPYYTSLDGLPHFNKPILTYWAVSAGYAAFGIDVFSSRLAFLLAGCLLVWLTYRMSRSLFHREGEALLSAAILSSNVVVYFSSVRSTPDILQCLFLTASMHGFLNLIVSRDRSWSSHLMAYLGAALAFETKGFPGLLLPAYALLFCLWRKPNGARAKELIEPASMLLALVVAVSWFAVVYVQHGGAALFGHPGLDDGFFTDQISDNVSRTRLDWLLALPPNVAGYVACTLGYFLPWSIPLIGVAVVDRRSIADAWHEHGQLLRFLLGWSVLLLLLFASGNHVRGRYLLPIYPLISIVGAHVLARGLREGRSASWLQRAIRTVLYAALLVVPALAWAGASIDARIVEGGVAFVLLSIPLCILAARSDPRHGLAALALFAMLTFSLFDLFVLPVFDPSPVPRLAQRLVELAPPGARIGTLFASSEYVPSRIRVSSAGRLDPVKLHESTDRDELEAFPLLVLSERQRGSAGLDGYRIEDCGYAYENWTARDLWSLIRSRDKQSVLERKRVASYIAIKRAASATTGASFMIPSRLP